MTDLAKGFLLLVILLIAIRMILGLKVPSLGRKARVLVDRVARGVGRLSGAVVLLTVTALWHLMLGVASGLVRHARQQTRRFTVRRL